MDLPSWQTDTKAVMTTLVATPQMDLGLIGLLYRAGQGRAEIHQNGQKWANQGQARQINRLYLARAAWRSSALMVP